VARLVQRQVAASGAAAAIEASGTQLTYAALDVAANRLAHRLRDLGVGPDITVGVCLPRSPELVIGLLAILKAGGAYVPLDPAYPLDRLQVMMEQARPRVLMSHGELVDGLPQTRGKVLLLDRDAAAIAQESEADPEPLAQGADLAYVIFTSGSTGRPKGVAMPHQGLCNLLEWQARGFGGDRPRRTLQFASPSFDVGFQDIFSTLATGGTLVVVPDELRRDFDRLASFIDDERIERLFLPPLALRELAVRLAGAPATTPDVEIIAAGEQLEITPAIRELFTSRPGWTLHNQYGPTESHVVTSHSLAGDPSGWPDLPPIGRPIPNARVYLLDGGGEPVPAGVPGELFIGGVSVARGYLNQPRLTAERFLPDPFAGGDARMYRTGDLARWGDDGTIEFLGRVDDQVKIRGFRVEPAEVVTALLRHPEVAHAAVVAEEHTPPLRRLVAYVVPASQPAPGPRELRDFLAASLPDYMVPAAFLTLDTLPMTPNGKLDRRALPPSDVSPEPVQAPAPPASETEARVAAIWAEILGFERVGLDDNFFELGGHSLLAGDVVSRCSRALGVSLAMRILFAGPTVREMSTAIEEARRRGDVETAIPRARRRRVSDVAGDA
jgi:amino acid adenylation domain-containing protein